MRLFEEDRVYPSDRVGPYVELSGAVVEAGPPGLGAVRVVVQTEQGRITGYWEYPLSWEERDDFAQRLPAVADRATIRVYDAGGGWYPDNRVMACTRAQ